MYSLITSGMTWSYSRISSFNSCPYKFFLTYIVPCAKIPQFFSGYGSFMHELLADFYRGHKTKDEIFREYLTEFRTRVTGKAPDHKIFSNYFQQGLSHLKELVYPEQKILGVENHVSFQVGDHPFIGYIDLLLRDEETGDITVCDHKSRALKPRSTRGKYTKTDEELDHYLRQLYLYSIPVEQTYGILPTTLAFNCYRTGTVIREPFSASAFQEAKDWASSSIEQIIHAKDFSPKMDYYFCKYICDVHDSCEYYAMQN